MPDDMPLDRPVNDELDVVEFEVITGPRPRSRPWMTLMMTLVIFAAFLLAQSLVAGGFLAYEYERNPNLDVDEWFERMQYDGMLVAVGTFVSAAVSVPLILIAARMVSRGAVRDLLGLRMPSASAAAAWLLALAAYLAAIHAVQWAMNRQEVPEFMREIYGTAGLTAPLLIAIVLVAPLSEELLFRGLLYGGLAPSAIGGIGAAIVSSLAWAVIHVQYDLFTIATIFVAGLLFAAARQATGSVLLCILLHAAMNLAATIELAAMMQ